MGRMIKVAVLAGGVLGALALQAGTASAAPNNNQLLVQLSPITGGALQNLQVAVPELITVIVNPPPAG